MLPIISPVRNRPQKIYSDFDRNLTVNPLSRDVVVNYDEVAVKQAMQNLLLTSTGERLMQPTIGSNIRSTLFEPNTPATMVILKQQIIDTINNFEPRVTLIDVELNSDYDADTVIVKIYFYIRNREVPLSTTVLLERTR